MAAIALLKFSQGARIGAAGHALIVEDDALVVAENAVNTDVASWRLELLSGPPGSAFECMPGVPVVLAEEPNDATPYYEAEPAEAFFGCYRMRLSVWSGANFSGAKDVDIRNFCVLTPNNKYVIPPYQKLPDPLPLALSGQPGAKPDELNFEGQPFGWAGANFAHPSYGQTYAQFRLLNAFIEHIDSLGSGGGTILSIAATARGVDNALTLTATTIEGAVVVDLPNLDMTASNIAIGVGTAPAATIGSNLLAVGHGIFATGGASNSLVVGHGAMASGGGNELTVLGNAALPNSGGVQSVVIGSGAMQVGGVSETVAIGHGVLGTATGTIDEGVFIGKACGPTGAAGNRICMIGANAGQSVDDASSTLSVLIGAQCMQSSLTTIEDTFVGAVIGPNITASGYNVALGSVCYPTLTTGQYNVAVGWQAGGGATSEGQTVSIGANTAVSGTGSVAVGAGAESAGEGVAAGLEAIAAMGGVSLGARANTGTGFNNIVIGKDTGNASSWEGTGNILLGATAASGVLDVGSNVIIGSSAAQILTNGVSNILVGAGAEVPAGNTSNFLNLGNTLTGHLTTGRLALGAGAGNDLTTQNATWGVYSGNADTTALERFDCLGTNGAEIYLHVGDRDPNGNVSATVGSIYLSKESLGAIWQNVDGTTGWTRVSRFADGGINDLVTLGPIASGGSEEHIVPLLVDGAYVFTVVLTATDATGAQYVAAYSFGARKVSGTLSGAEMAEPQDILLNEPAVTESDEEVMPAFANSSGDLSINVTNAVAVHAMNVTIATTWSLVAFPATP